MRNYLEYHVNLLEEPSDVLRGARARRKDLSISRAPCERARARSCWVSRTAWKKFLENPITSIENHVNSFESHAKLPWESCDKTQQLRGAREGEFNELRSSLRARARAKLCGIYINSRKIQ